MSVNLAKVKTNEELMDLFFDLVFPVKGAEFPLTLSFENIVFVMEDIDAASKVVFARTEAKKLRKRLRKRVRDAEKDQAKEEKDSKEPATGGTQTPEESLDSPSPSGAGVGLDSESSDDEEPRQDAAQAVSALVECVQAAVQGQQADDSGDEARKKAPVVTTWGGVKDEDQLNLAGLLNVLDGVVDSPGRILVMTTNHPEKLDPALIRPGRINKQIHLGPMAPDCMAEMASHYLGEALTDSQKAQLRDVVCSPARVEQACAEAGSFGELMELLGK